MPSQGRFHASTARFKGYSGPIGSGKSQALCQEAIKLSYINAGRLGLIGAPTYPMLRDATITTLLEILGHNRIPFDYNKAENHLVMKDTRSKILFRPVDEFERLRGTNLAWFGIDELTYCQEEAWLRLEGRLRDPKAKRLCGCAVWTPKGFDWVYRRFISEPVAGYEMIIARPYENRHLLGLIPDFYERLKKSYDERFYHQEVLGEYLNVTAGRVYHAFDRSRNITALALNPLLPVRWALDFNVDPMCSVVAQRDGDLVKVLDEIVLPRSGTPAACEEFLARYPNPWSGVIIYGDASGAHMQTTGSADYQLITEAFCRGGVKRFEQRVPPSNPAVRDRVSLMNAMLRNADNEARLLVDPRCKELIRDFEEVTYQPGTTVIDKSRDPKRTHLSDALGYLVWQEMRIKRPVGHQEKSLGL